jgi:hypothetical protein
LGGISVLISEQSHQTASTKRKSPMEYKPGTRWKSAVSDTEVVIVSGPKTAVSLQCGGHDVVPLGDETPSGLTMDPSLAEGSLIGKRYVHEPSGLEILCTKGGEGTLAVDGAPLALKGAKPLPSSD